MDDGKSAAQAAGAIVLAASIWGLSPLYYKALSHVPPLELLAHRTLWSLFFIGLFALATGRGRRVVEALRAKGAVFVPEVDGVALTFSADGDGTFIDAETGSTWNIFGEATAGELVGTQLEQFVHIDTFWFAWIAFHPSSSVA